MQGFFFMQKFEHHILVEEQHLDELQHVNNVVFVDFLQQAAIAHWYAKADHSLAQSCRWVVRKHEIEYLKPAFLKNILTVKTWVAEFNGVSTLRKYEVYHEQSLLVKATTLWICLDSQLLKPKRLTKEEMKAFF